MKPGRGLDALVAEKVMGLTVERKQTGIYYQGANGLWPIVPHYSTSITDAWQVVEKLVSSPGRDYALYPFTIREDRYTGAYSKGNWLCSFGADSSEYENGPCGDDTDAMMYWETTDGKIAAGETAPHAICLGALQAVGVKLKEDA